MSVPYKQLKIWAGELELPKGGFGMKKPRLISELVKAMKAVKDELDEDQLGWLAEQSGEKPSTTEKAKAKKKKIVVVKGKKEEKEEKKEKKGKKIVVVKGAATSKKKKKKKEVEPVEEPVEEVAEPTEDAPTKIKVDISKKALVSYATELGISTKGMKTDKDYNKLGQEIFAEVSNLDEAEREELSKELFDFYTAISGQLEEGSEEAEEPTTEEIPDEIPIPASKAKIKVWAGKMGIQRKGKSDQEIAREILEEFQTLDDDDKEDLPDALVEWANSVFESEATEGVVEEEGAEDDDVVEVPDFGTLKEYALAVGIKLSEIKKAKGDEATLAGMIIDVYDEDDEGEYPPELVAFYKEVHGVDDDDSGPEAEEVAEEEVEVEAPNIIGWLGELGYDPEDFAESPLDEQQQYLMQEYKDDPKQFDKDELEDALAYLKEYFPEAFATKKKKKKK